MREKQKRRPPSFLTEVDIADFPGESEVIFEVVTKSSSSGAAIGQIADVFEAAARAGMFSKEPAAKTIPIEVVSVERFGGVGVRYIWKVTGIQVGAYRMLLNMLDVTHHFEQPLASSRLLSPIGGGKRMHWNDLIDAPFPIKSRKPPFALRVKQNLEDSREPLIRLEFQREIHDEELEILVPLILAWDTLVIRGGYLQDLDDRDPDLDIDASLSSQQTYLAAANTVEHLFYEFIGPEAAYDTLVNMAVKLHRTFCPLAALEIG